MGVPAFFRWLSVKYPSVIIDCIEQKSQDVDGVRAPVDSTQPNPNEVEFDNLYLDMNGIVHPCTHPEDKPAPANENEMMIAIFECIDRLFAIVRPRKVLYMAIDGVAPRAKMNQQRSRRFRASKEAAEKVMTIQRLRQELSEKGMFLPEEKEKKEHFDSNCITPGTPFMDRLSMSLQYYIYDRLNNDPGWKNIKVFLSDANVPGEGEHKIMDYIRRQRAQPHHDPNTQHVLCGADADLIMLGLATHEPYFTIIREKFKQNRPRPCDLCRRMGHDMTDCLGVADPSELAGMSDDPAFGEETEYIFVRLSVLREYLRRDLAMPNLPFKYEFERAVDDWVFMCFFVGNDFLPHLPSLEIREKAIDRLVKLYKEAVYKTGGFITNSGHVNPSRVQLIMVELGKMEDNIFRERRSKDLYFKARNKANKRQAKESHRAPAWVPQGQFAPQALGGKNRIEAVTDCKKQAHDMRVQGLKASGEGPSSRKRGAQDSESESDDETPDEVRLYEGGFKDRYYESKFGVLPSETGFRHRVAAEYTLGLCWVLRYYYQGCASWKWYFPYHYAPFASDFVGIEGTNVEFDRNTIPTKPLEQLMSVFPAASRSHVPEPWAKLMIDPDCPIIDFYPEDFKIDLNGKKFAWQGVALLPFVDEKRLKNTLEPVYPLLTPDEVRRNQRGDDLMYVRENHPGFESLEALYNEEVDRDKEMRLDPSLFDGVDGNVLFSENRVERGGTVSSPLAGLEASADNRAICVRYRDPKYAAEFIFPAARLEGAQDPPNVLKPGDLQDNARWRPRIGFNDQRRDSASLGAAGHRMLNRQMNRGANIPPPSGGGYNNRSNDNYGRRNDNYGGGTGGYNHQRGGHNNDNYGRRNNYDRNDRNNDNYGRRNDNYDRQGGNYRGGRGGYNDHRGGRGGYNHGGGYNDQRGEDRQRRGGGNSSGGNQRGGGSYGYYTSNYQRSGR